MVELKTIWEGPLHFHKIQPLVPVGLPVGMPASRAAATPASRAAATSLFLVGIPHCATSFQQTLLKKSLWLRKLISTWVPLPIRISFINPVFFSNSAIGIFNTAHNDFDYFLKPRTQSEQQLSLYIGLLQIYSQRLRAFLLKFLKTRKARNSLYLLDLSVTKFQFLKPPPLFRSHL